MEKQNLIDILHGDISLIDKVNQRDIALFDMDVPVTPSDVKNMLVGYLSGNITADDLNNWAGFICIRAEYCPPELDDSDPDRYEDMFYVIQRLSTPEIDGEITEQLVKQYLSELDRYFK